MDDLDRTEEVAKRIISRETMSHPNPYTNPEDWRRPSADVRRLVATCDALAVTVDLTSDDTSQLHKLERAYENDTRRLRKERDEWKLRAQNAEDVARRLVDAGRESATTGYVERAEVLRKRIARCAAVLALQRDEAERTIAAVCQERGAHAMKIEKALAYLARWPSAGNSADLVEILTKEEPNA